MHNLLYDKKSQRKRLFDTTEKKPKKTITYITVGLMIIAMFIGARPVYLLAKAHYAQYLLDNAWLTTIENNQQQTGSQVKPWAWADGHPIAKLTYKGAPNGSATWIILAGMSGRNMAFAPSWLQSSAAPNQKGNTVISAHNDSHFTSLEHIELGDLFTLTNTKGETLTYKTNNILITDKTDNSAYLYSEHKQLTLITCYPFNATSSPKNLRLVVQAQAI